MRKEETGGPELELIPHTSPRGEMCAARTGVSDGGALFVCPTIRDSERKGTGTGVGRRRV